MYHLEEKKLSRSFLKWMNTTQGLYSLCITLMTYWLSINHFISSRDTMGGFFNCFFFISTSILWFSFIKGGKIGTPTLRLLKFHFRRWSQSRDSCQSISRCNLILGTIDPATGLLIFSSGCNLVLVALTKMIKGSKGDFIEKLRWK